jgi:hypothetical protein
MLTPDCSVRTVFRSRFHSPILCGLLLLLCGLIVKPVSFAQVGDATLSGTVLDSSGAAAPDVEVTVTNADTNVTVVTKTNESGIYNVEGLKPGRYRVIVMKQGFKQITLTDVTLNVQDTVSRNFNLELGATSESITVNGSGLNINTTDASVSTVVDRQFVENIPLNGRSFQDLLTLAPGVVAVPSNGVGGSGEISVNGQRTEANYFTVDGVSANTGTAVSNVVIGAGFSGGTPGETVLGTTQSMVSIDALQEFRATTSSYSAEYGRTPGGQFSFSTRSGTNQWHGSAYDYFRNDVMDANNWFNNAAKPPVPRLPERQNDFGGTLGGPIRIPGLYNGRGKTFFFFSYEGLRLVTPQPFFQYIVPNVALRQQVPARLQPFLDAFPVPNGGEDGLNDGLAFFDQAYSAPSSLDNVGIRLDHNFGDKLKVFGRYSTTPSSAWTRGLAVKQIQEITVRSITLGATSSVSPRQTNEVRFNLTQNNLMNSSVSTNYGGAVPFSVSSLPAPNGQPLTLLGSQLQFCVCYGAGVNLFLFANSNTQRQYNVTDTHSWSVGAHNITFGVDWRRLSTAVNPIATSEFGQFLSEAALLTNTADLANNAPFTEFRIEPVYHNFSAFAQDEWKASPRLSLSMGLRWDVNPSPGNLVGPSPYTVDQVTNLATTKLATAGTPLWKTDWHGFAPRLGLAYQLTQKPGHETVVRTGFGLFYDTGNTQGSGGFTNAVGFTSTITYSNVSFPLTSAQVTLPAPSAVPPYNAFVFAFDPNLTLPYTMQWNLALERGLGAKQTLTVNYVGSAGRRLLSEFVYFPDTIGNPNFALGNGLGVTSNKSSSDYHALQVRYHKILSHGLQVLASYTWSHSIDDASSNFQIYELLRASSDFDVHHNFQAALTYDVPDVNSNGLFLALLKHWGVDTRISARSGLPVDILNSSFSVDPSTHRFINFHPNLVPRQPIYISSLQSCPATASVISPIPVPGGRLINICAFAPAPTDTEGNVPRNFARSFDAVQVDLAFRREFPIHDRLRLQFRAEAFNLFNHPIFGSIDSFLPDGPSLFGYANNTLNNQLGGLNPLYQAGGARSLQLMLKLMF